jgi:hypothetical protein
MRSEQVQPLLPEIGQLRQLTYDPNCEMAHRQEPFSLVVLSVWLPSLGERATRSRKRLRHEIEFDESTQLCYRPFVFDRCEKHAAF